MKKKYQIEYEYINYQYYSEWRKSQCSIMAENEQTAIESCTRSAVPDEDCGEIKIIKIICENA